MSRSSALLLSLLLLLCFILIRSSSRIFLSQPALPVVAVVVQSDLQEEESTTMKITTQPPLADEGEESQIYDDDDDGLPRLVVLGPRVGVLLLSAVILPKDRRILLTSMTSRAIRELRDAHPSRLGYNGSDGDVPAVYSRYFYFNHEQVVETNFRYAPRDFDMSTSLVPISKLMDRLEIFVRSRRFLSGPCTEFDLLAARLSKHMGLVYCSIPDDAVEAIKSYARHGNSTEAKSIRIRLVLNEKRQLSHDGVELAFKISLEILEAGITESKIGSRPLPEPLSSNEAWSKDNFGKSGTMSICIANVRTPNPYIQEIMRYHKRVGISHVYLGIEHEYSSTERTNLINRYNEDLKSFIEDKFVTLVNVIPPKEIIMHKAKIFFLEPCYTIARQFDTFVAIHDVDELILIRKPEHLGENIPKYLLSLVDSGNYTVLSDLDSDNYEIASPFPRFAGRERDVTKFCQVIFAAASPVLQNNQRSFNLAKDFPKRASHISYFTQTNLMKAIAITRNTLTVELHKHTNCELPDPKRKRLKIFQSSPYDHRIMPDPSEVVILHHFDLFSKRRAKMESDQDLVPSEYALLYSNLRRLLRRLRR